MRRGRTTKQIFEGAAEGACRFNGIRLLGCRCPRDVIRPLPQPLNQVHLAAVVQVESFEMWQIDEVGDLVC
ncbi:MAG: hypothetical protein LC791_20280 [Acidobacteria bacterium]|nr:hypothetical protein [Acidobacteriota bacterium]